MSKQPLVSCACGLTKVPNTGWDGYTSGRVDCSVLCSNTGKYNKKGDGQ